MAARFLRLHAMLYFLFVVFAHEVEYRCRTQVLTAQLKSRFAPRLSSNSRGRIRCLVLDVNALWNCILFFPTNCISRSLTTLAVTEIESFCSNL
jgi:hypothetical protein